MGNRVHLLLSLNLLTKTKWFMLRNTSRALFWNKWKQYQIDLLLCNRWKTGLGPNWCSMPKCLGTSRYHTREGNIWYKINKTNCVHMRFVFLSICTGLNRLWKKKRGKILNLLSLNTLHPNIFFKEKIIYKMYVSSWLDRRKKKKTKRILYRKMEGAGRLLLWLLLWKYRERVIEDVQHPSSMYLGALHCIIKK